MMDHAISKHLLPIELRLYQRSEGHKQSNIAGRLIDSKRILRNQELQQMGIQRNGAQIRRQETRDPRSHTTENESTGSSLIDS